MSEPDLLSSALSLVDHPVLITENGIIEYMNGGAAALAGGDLTGSRASALLPEHIINTQTPDFTAAAPVCKKNCTVRSVGSGDKRIYVLFCDHPLPQESNELIYAGMRSSLSNIKFAVNCISVIAEEYESDKLRDYICALNRSYYKMKHVLENISSLTAFSSGNAVFSPKPVNLTALFSKTIDVLSELTPDSGIKMHLHADGDMSIVGDECLLRRLLLNLLSNSMMSCGRNGRINVSLFGTDRSIVLSVDDDGSGIDPRELPYVFSKYRRIDDLSDVRGSGMGLAVVSGIAQLHGGTVVIESRGKDKGTSVRVMLSRLIEADNKFYLEGDFNRETLSDVLTVFSYLLPSYCYSEIFED